MNPNDQSEQQNQYDVEPYDQLRAREDSASVKPRSASQIGDDVHENWDKFKDDVEEKWDDAKDKLEEEWDHLKDDEKTIDQKMDDYMQSHWADRNRNQDQ